MKFLKCSSRRRSFKAKTSSFNSQGSRRHSALNSRLIRSGVGNPFAPNLFRHNGMIGELYPFDNHFYNSKTFIRDNYMYPRQPGQSMDPRYPYAVHEFPTTNSNNKVHIAGDHIPKARVSSHRRRLSESASVVAAATSSSPINSTPNQVYWIQADDGSLKHNSRSNSLGYIRNVDDLLRNENQIRASGSRHGTPHLSHQKKKKGDKTTWEYQTVVVTRVPGYGFGIAVSGGRDNPHFANGDPSIAVSDVLKGGPAEDRLQVNDRIISVNGVSLENVEYATAVQVLRDSGNTVTLVVKRRVPIVNSTSHQHSHSMSSVGLLQQPLTTPVLNAATTSQNVSGPGQPIKITLKKSNKKEDYGVVLGCRLFIKEISSKARDQLAVNGYSLQEGDIISRIHNTNCGDTMSLKEAKKIIDGCKEHLNLVVLRDVINQGVPAHSVNVNGNGMNNSTTQTSLYSHTQQVSNCSNNLDDPYLGGGASYSSQNLYVQPPTRASNGLGGLVDEKSNLTPRGRLRGPLMDVSLSQLDRPSTPSNANSSRTRLEEPPRPPPPRDCGTGEDFYSSRRQLYEEDPLQRSRQSAEPRFISFQKEGSVGIRLTGGNEAGIFVTAVQPGSPASLQGLTPGDKILKVNDMDMHGVTREEAVLFLLSLQDRIDLIVQYCKEEYEEVVANQRGDSFHIKTHFHCDNPSKGEMAFKAGDVFRVIDTLHNGVVGSWQVLRIGRGHQEMQRGVIPNKSRAEELATAQFNATKKEMNATESRGNFFRRRRSTHRRSKSLSRENWDDVVFSDSISKFPAYERVVLRHPGFVRPVVLFGPVSDISREKLIKDFPDKFTAPLQDDDKTNSKCRIVRLSNIRDIMDRGKHALLDITPNAVDRLNYAQFYPIVVFLKTDNKHVIKQMRQGVPKSAHKSSKKLLEQCQKLERVWSHIFSTQIVINDTESWYRKLREAIDLQQSGAVWMSETKLPESPTEMIFPPYIAPPCNLACCRPTSMPSYSERRTAFSLSPKRPLTPPRPSPAAIQMQLQLTNLHTLTPPASMPLSSIQQQQEQVQSLPTMMNIIKTATSMPGGLAQTQQQMSMVDYRNIQPCGKRDSSSMSNLTSETPRSDRSELRTTPYYYNELKNSSSVFDSNLNLRSTIDDELNFNKNIRKNNRTNRITREKSLNEIVKTSSNETRTHHHKNGQYESSSGSSGGTGSVGGSVGNTIFEKEVLPIPALRNFVTNGSV